MTEGSKVRFPDAIRRPAIEVESDIEGLRGYMLQGRDGSQVLFWECDTETKAKPHTHEYDEYCLVIEGVCKETIEGKTTIMNKGDECVIPAGKLHWATMGPNYRAIDFFGGPRCKYKKSGQ